MDALMERNVAATIFLFRQRRLIRSGTKRRPAGFENAPHGGALGFSLPVTPPDMTALKME
jgi:hypothetical protein